MQLFAVVCLFCALSFYIASAQTTSGTAFVVADVDRLCATDADCRVVGNTCCYESRCGYVTVNVTAEAKYNRLLTSYISANCVNSPCLGSLCQPPTPTCISSGAVSSRLLCTLPRPVISPVTNTVPAPVQEPECVTWSGANCENTCLSRFLRMANNSDCLPDPITSCINRCKNTLATCSMTATSEPNTGGTTTTVKACAYVARDQTKYNTCVDACRNPVPPPSDLVCRVTVGTRCNNECTAVSANSTVGILAPTCTPTTEAACFNECTQRAECKLTNLGCKFVPANNTDFTECNAKCIPPATPRCLKTGCSGEICSNGAVASPCVFTCEAGCYQTAVCQGAADGSCNWAASVELDTCLSKCKQTTTPPPPPPVEPICKISGCQRQLCVPYSEPPLLCPTIALVEPTCENRCLQYAKCDQSRLTLAGVDPATNSGTTSPTCGWVPDPLNPGAYSECLQRCRTNENPCFVSGCGAECSTRTSLQPCIMSLIAPDCWTRCKTEFTDCNMTASGCMFLPNPGLRACQEKCAAAVPSTTTRSPEVVRPICPTGVPVAECLVDPCQVNRCPAHPDAVCKADYCGGCHAIFTDKVTGQRVNCDGDCAGKPCGDCLKNSLCSFCSGVYRATDADGKSTEEEYGFCIASAGEGADRCISSNGRIVADATTCPSVSGRADVSVTANTDDTIPRMQGEVAKDTRPILQRLIILITLIINETTNARNGLNNIQVFVDVIGNVTRDDDIEICDVLIRALVTVDSRVSAHVNAGLQCKLSERTSLKRDASYVADMSFPANSNVQRESSATLIFPFAAIIAGIIALH